MCAGAPRCPPQGPPPRRARRAAGRGWSGDGILVGPDNGLLSWAIAALGGAQRACQLTNGEWWLHPVSPTFHGRDIFTPVAARLAAGGNFAEAGTEIDVEELVALPAPTSRVRDGEAEGEVMSVDRFGNVQLSIAAAAS